MFSQKFNEWLDTWVNSLRLIIIKINPMMDWSSHMLYLLFDLKLIPSPVVENRNNAINLPQLYLLIFVQHAHTAKIKIASFWLVLKQRYDVTAINSSRCTFHISSIKLFKYTIENRHKSVLSSKSLIKTDPEIINHHKVIIISSSSKLITYTLLN